MGVKSRYVRIIEDLIHAIASPDPIHGLPHIERVRRLALWIARHYTNVDLEVLEIASLLHDIARNTNDECHAVKSAEIARTLLEAIGYPKDKIEKVVEAIEAHSFSSGKAPRSLEAKILSDADKLDALGAIGIARVFMYSGAIGRSLEDSIEHFRIKILRLPKFMYTDIGRKEALRRVKIVEKFIKSLEDELRWLEEVSRVE